MWDIVRYIVGLGGGVQGSPVIPAFGRLVHVSVIGFPIALGFLLSLLGFALGFAWAAATAYERRLDESVRAQAAADVSRLVTYLVATVVASAFLYRVGAFGQPPQFHFLPAVAGLLVAYSWKANRPDTLALILVAYSSSVVFDSGALYFDSGTPHVRWFVLARYLWGECGWMLLAMIISVSILKLIGFPERFLNRAYVRRRIQR